MDLDKTMTWKDVINIWNAKSNVLERQKKKKKKSERKQEKKKKKHYLTENRRGS